MESWPTLRAEEQQQSKNILHVCPGAEWRRLKRTLWCGVARRGGISTTTMYCMCLIATRDRRQGTRDKRQETRDEKRPDSIRTSHTVLAKQGRIFKKRSTQSDRSWTLASQNVELRERERSPVAQRHPSQRSCSRKIIIIWCEAPHIHLYVQFEAGPRRNDSPTRRLALGLR